MNAFKSPRLWLFIWGGAGLILGASILISAALEADGRPGAPRQASAAGPENTAQCKRSVARKHPDFLTGEMADFTYAFTERRAPGQNFVHAGETTSMAAFKGRVTLVNFWATWCPPCLRELPSLDALEAALGGDDFEVVAVAADPRGPQAAGEYLERLNIKNLKLYTDEQLRFASAVGEVSTVLPVSILYDREGLEIGRLVGEADWQSAEARALIGNLIDCT
ncbi:MAG: TlpA disulfide reductase family protein [Pseudomonadota bacterium]